MAAALLPLPTQEAAPIHLVIIPVLALKELQPAVSLKWRTMYGRSWPLRFLLPQPLKFPGKEWTAILPERNSMNLPFNVYGAENVNPEFPMTHIWRKHLPSIVEADGKHCLSDRLVGLHLIRQGADFLTQCLAVPADILDQEHEADTACKQVSNKAKSFVRSPAHVHLRSNPLNIRRQDGLQLVEGHCGKTRHPSSCRQVVKDTCLQAEVHPHV
mmetsp:Transcript_16306/g.35314  ORF Transcript_16306/g.35314 Transcript_16306/m.35314 type:complete len:214 (+) Transcript_16306:674-1315(+)